MLVLLITQAVHPNTPVDLQLQDVFASVMLGCSGRTYGGWGGVHVAYIIGYRVVKKPLQLGIP